MVSIDIDLDATGVRSDLAALKVQLEALEDDLDFDLDLDGDLGKKLDKLGDQLSDLTEGLTKDLDESIDRLENLDVDPIMVEGNGDSGGGTGSDSGDGNVSRYDRRDGDGSLLSKSRMNELIDTNEFTMNFDRVASEVADLNTGEPRNGWTIGDTTIPQNLIPGGRNRGAAMMASHGITNVDPEIPEIPDLFDFGKEGIDSKRAGAIPNPARKILPKMQTWWNIIAAMIPALGAMAVQAAGVAAAMGSVAVAGAAVVGLGLIGHGDDMASSWESAKEQLSTLKKEMFQTFQPTAQLFSGVSADFLEFMPGEFDRIAESMAGLMVFEDDFFSLFRGGTQWIAEFIDLIVQNEAVISDLTASFGKIIGQSLIDLFEFLIQEAAANKSTLIELGEVFKLIAIFLYSAFVATANLLTVLKPIFNIFGGLAKLLNNSLVVGLLTAAVIMAAFTYGTIAAASAVSTLLTTLASGMIPGLSAAFSMLQAYTFQALVAAGANYTLAQSLATVLSVATLLTGIGIAAWAGMQAYEGMKQVNKLRKQMDVSTGQMPTGSAALGGAGSRGGPSVTNNYDVTVNGDPDNATMEGLESKLTRRDREITARELPSPPKGDDE